MKRLIALALILAVATVRAGDVTWTKHSDKAGGYSASFPRQPRPIVRTIEKDGLTLKLRCMVAEWSGGAAIVGYSDYPKGLVNARNVQKVLDGAVGGVVQKPGVELVEDLKFSFKGLPGRAVTVRQGDATLQDYIIMKGDRMYQIIGVRPTGFPQEDLFKRFFDSFQLR